MNRGRWVFAIILLVALAMGLATWPLLKVRRKKEIRRTELLLGMLAGACDLYRRSHGEYPLSLEGLIGPGAPRDAWGRPIGYARSTPPRVWSLGADPDDPSDDILPRP